MASRPPSPRDDDDLFFSRWLRRLETNEQPGERFVLAEVIHEVRCAPAVRRDSPKGRWRTTIGSCCDTRPRSDWHTMASTRR